MANPNLNGATQVYADNALIRLVNTTETNLLKNPANSGKIFFLESVYVANVSGDVAALTINIYNVESNQATPVRLIYELAVAPDGTLLPVLKDGTIAIKENQSIYVQASVENALHVVASWKEMLE